MEQLIMEDISLQFARALQRQSLVNKMKKRSHSKEPLCVFIFISHFKSVQGLFERANGLMTIELHTEHKTTAKKEK
jgi:hypothetical protein